MAEPGELVKFLGNAEMAQAEAPGLYMIENFHRVCPSPSYSRLKRFLHPDQKIGKSSSMTGLLLHTAVLEGAEAMKNRYALGDDSWNYRSAEDKSKRDALAKETGKEVIRPKELIEPKQMYQALQDNPETKKVLDMPGDCEIGFCAELLGVKIKGIIDKLVFRKSGVIVIDLKGTRCKGPDDFKDSIIKYGYDAQGSLYRDAIASLVGDEIPVRFFWLCVSPVNLNSWIQELEPWMHVTGKRWYEDTLSVYSRYNDEALMRRMQSMMERQSNG